MATDNTIQNSSSTFHKNSLSHSLLRVCYFGIYKKDFSRNEVYMQGLHDRNIIIHECQDDRPGIQKYWHLYKKHRKLRGQYDVLIVGYPGHIMVPFARLLSRKVVVADLLGSLEDAEINSHSPSFFKRIKARIADFLAVVCSGSILLESEAQRSFFIKTFGPSNKYHVVYTGVSNDFDKKNNKEVVVKNNVFTVLFRGRLTPESGIRHILMAARLLKSRDDIRFKIIGGGQLLSFAQKEIREYDLSNIELISHFLPRDVMVNHILSAHVSLGQFETNPRLDRTIPHKLFESFALGIPYLTGDAPAVSELVKDGVTGFMVPLADPEALVKKIVYLLEHKDTLDHVSQAEYAMYQNKLSSRELSGQMLDIIEQIMSLRK